VCARSLPAGNRSLLDFGSGGGFPGIPIAICRAEIAVTLAESQGKKAAFLQEVVRVLGLSAKVHPQRAELLGGLFDCVTLRAVDRMDEAVATGAGWSRPRLAGCDDYRSRRGAVRGRSRVRFSWSQTVPLPYGRERVLASESDASGYQLESRVLADRWKSFAPLTRKRMPVPSA